MNPIEATTPASSLFSGATGRKGGSKMGKDEFLRLLVTQLRNQDPTNPMDGQQFAAQLAQFSSVEQLMNIEKTLGSQGEMSGLLAQSINSGVAAGLIGKTVEAEGNVVGFNGADEAHLGFELPDSARQVTITIRDANGNLVREIDLKTRGAGKNTVTWDGKNSAGIMAQEGKYTFEVSANNGDNAPVYATPYSIGRVDRVTFGQDGIRLWMGGASIAMSSVRSVED